MRPHAAALEGPPRPLDTESRTVPRTAPVKFAVYDYRSGGPRLLERAFERARKAGALFEVLESAPSPGALTRADVVIAPAWPPFHSSSAPLLAAMAAGKAVITTETEATAAWPAIDPQTWRPRGLAVHEPPIAVTVDPRDEEHSVMLAIRKLSADTMLREQLGRAARAWWEAHATPARAASAWAPIVREAATLSPPPRPDDWPKQFLLDGTELDTRDSQRVRPRERCSRALARRFPLIARLGRQPRIFDRHSHREVIQALPRRVPTSPSTS